jgi:hypothetical protein
LNCQLVCFIKCHRHHSSQCLKFISEHPTPLPIKVDKEVCKKGRMFYIKHLINTICFNMSNHHFSSLQSSSNLPK